MILYWYHCCTDSLTSACIVRSQWDFFSRRGVYCIVFSLSNPPCPPTRPTTVHPRSHCVPLLTPFSLPFYSICVLNQHFRAVCRRPAERQSMDLIMLPQIRIPPQICFPFSLCHSIKWLLWMAVKAGQHHNLQWKLKLLGIVNFPLAYVWNWTVTCRFWFSKQNYVNKRCFGFTEPLYAEPDCVINLCTQNERQIKSSHKESFIFIFYLAGFWISASLLWHPSGNKTVSLMNVTPNLALAQRQLRLAPAVTCRVGSGRKWHQTKRVWHLEEVAG